MRTVSFVDYVELEYEGNVFNKAFLVADIDNDNNNELVIGNVCGTIFIFKNSESSKPWAKAYDLGMISCIEVGDVFNLGKNVLISLSTEGWCNNFFLSSEMRREFLPPKECISTSNMNSNQCLNTSGETNSDNSNNNENIILKANYKQKMHGNAKCCLVADIDGDGLNELIVGYTDRVVRSFKWVDDTIYGHPKILINLQNFHTHQPMGTFVLSEKWKLAGQIGSMSINTKTDGRISILVSQPGGSYITLICSGSGDVQDDKTIKNHSTSSLANVSDALSYVSYYPLGSNRARNPGVSTEVISNISRRKKGNKDASVLPYYSAICTLDGTISIVEGNDIKLSLMVHHQLFAFNKLDITNDGTDELIACSWDGHTYIVNLNKEVVRFQFRENVAAFYAGMFSISKDKQVPCLCYATFNNRIFVYYDLKLPSVGISNLLDYFSLNSNILKDKGLNEKNPEEIKEIIKQLLYHNP